MPVRQSYLTWYSPNRAALVLEQSIGESLLESHLHPPQNQSFKKKKLGHINSNRAESTMAGGVYIIKISLHEHVNTLN